MHRYLIILYVQLIHEVGFGVCATSYASVNRNDRQAMRSLWCQLDLLGRTFPTGENYDQTISSHMPRSLRAASYNNDSMQLLLRACSSYCGPGRVLPRVSGFERSAEEGQDEWNLTATSSATEEVPLERRQPNCEEKDYFAEVNSFYNHL